MNRRELIAGTGAAVVAAVLPKNTIAGLAREINTLYPYMFIPCSEYSGIAPFATGRMQGGLGQIYLLG
jgi:hypothetical protein